MDELNNDSGSIVLNNDDINSLKNENSEANNEAPNNVKKSSKSVYYSDLIGSPIKNAITGATYPWKVGSKEEEKFFRVIVTCNPYRKKPNYMSPDIHKTFYDSPQSYMEHNKCKLDMEVVKKWEKTQI